ncbi:hypothetical protein MNBD_ALPHA11-949 [hydrothermal vent metagenome]|uniref:Chromosomal replication initiator protein DnaA domain-containing protein n=1 Tax=hydrothermal vent metagenome TaxID=652676 RepID=A0A3B0UUA9_9ZZZZ
MSVNGKKPDEIGGQLTFDLAYETSYAQKDFIVTEGNRLAFEHIISFPNWAAPLTLITGEQKSGKTHLGKVWAKLAGAKIVEAKIVGSKIATNDQLETLAGEEKQIPVLLDNVDRAGFDENALFHLLNQSMRDVRPVLMSAREPVINWPFLTDDVKSRARLASHFSLQAASDLQLSQMFAKLFDDRQIVVAPETISYLVARIERSPGEVFALSEILDRLALQQGKAIGKKIAAEAIKIRQDMATRNKHG